MSFSGPPSGPRRALARLWRRKKKARAMTAIRTATPPMVPPTIGPILSLPGIPAPPAGAAVWAGSVDREGVLDADDEDDLWVDFTDEVELSELGVCVKEMEIVGRVRGPVAPLADASTVVAMSLAVPHPNWE